MSTFFGQGHDGEDDQLDAGHGDRLEECLVLGHRGLIIIMTRQKAFSHPATI